MSAPGPCWRCGNPGVRTVAASSYCSTHLAELYRSYNPEVWALNGVGLPVGRMRPEFGPLIEDLQCCACGATWSAVAGDRCGWCRASRERLIAHQRDLLLRRPEVASTDNEEATLLAWGDRLKDAVTAGIVTKDEAARAWRRAVRDVVAA